MYNKVMKQAALKLSKQDLSTHLSKLPGWTVQSDALEKDFKMKNFEETWAFLNQVSMRSHLWGHHPTILTTYNNVKITLTTHDVNGISDIDIKLARRIDNYNDLYQK